MPYVGNLRDGGASLVESFAGGFEVGQRKKERDQAMRLREEGLKLDQEHAARLANAQAGQEAYQGSVLKLRQDEASRAAAQDADATAGKAATLTGAARADKDYAKDLSARFPQFSNEIGAYSAQVSEMEARGERPESIQAYSARWLDRMGPQFEEAERERVSKELSESLATNKFAGADGATSPEYAQQIALLRQQLHDGTISPMQAGAAQRQLVAEQAKRAAKLKNSVLREQSLNNTLNMLGFQPGSDEYEEGLRLVEAGVREEMTYAQARSALLRLADPVEEKTGASKGPNARDLTDLAKSIMETNVGEAMDWDTAFAKARSLLMPPQEMKAGGGGDLAAKAKDLAAQGYSREEAARILAGEAPAGDEPAAADPSGTMLPEGGGTEAPPGYDPLNGFQLKSLIPKGSGRPLTTPKPREREPRGTRG